MICLSCLAVPFVAEEHTAAGELLEEAPGHGGDRLVGSICDLLLDHASALVPAARAAARAR